MAAAVMNRDERRDVILDVAKAFFLSNGYAATSMSAIAAKLGGSKGTLYNYFKSKEDLFAAVMQRQCAELAQSLFEFDVGGVAPRERLVHFGGTFLDTLMRDDSIRIQRLVTAETERFPELGRAFYDSGPKVVLDRLGAYIGQLMDQGMLRKDDPRVAATRFKDLTLSGVYQLKLWGVLGDFTAKQMDEQVEGAVDTFLRAYAPDR